MLILGIPALIYFQPAVAGADHAYVVLTGSMTPTYRPGDVVLVDAVAPRELQVGDVVTFYMKAGVLVTHRIIGVEQQQDGTRAFRTQGDANEEADPFLVTEKMLVGRVDGSIPYWGQIVNFMRTKTGTALLVVGPCILIIIREFVRLYKMLVAAKTAKASAEGSA